MGKTILVKNVNNELWKKIKAEAVLRDKYIHEVLEEVLSFWLSNNRQKPSPLTTILVKENDGELWKEIKREAKDKKLTLGEIVNMAILNWLNINKR